MWLHLEVGNTLIDMDWSLADHIMTARVTLERKRATKRQKDKFSRLQGIRKM